MRQARDEQGFALVSAVMLLMVILGLGLALLLFTDQQQRASLRSQQTEAAFNLAEAALNAQVGQISRAWPAKSGEAYPSACTKATTTSTNGCPTGQSLENAYPKVGAETCSAGVAKDAWGSELSNQWTTYVRDDGYSSTVFNSAAEQNEPSYDANEDGKLWVRSVGVVNCRMVPLVTLVSRQQVAANFPTDAVSGNWFEITNKGKHQKGIINLSGEPPGQPGEIGMRCERSPCEVWDQSHEQIEPPPSKKGEPLPTPLMNEAELAAMRSQALAAGTLRTPTIKGCPTKLEDLSGLPAYVEGCGNLKLTTGVANSKASPGFLVLADGTLELKGNSEFYGVIYAHNPTNSSGAVVDLGGNATVVGAIDVDGDGGIEFGSNGVNLVYNNQAIKELKTYAGATPTRNTFRVLPANQ